MRLLALAVVSLWAVSAHAAGDCAAAFSDCQEDCTLMYGGSIKVSNKKKFAKCAKACTKKRRTCDERVFETKNNALEEGSLDKSPTSRDVDEDGLPTRTAVSKGDDDAPASTRTRLDKVQEPENKGDDDAPPPRPAETVKAERAAPARDEAPPPKESPRAESKKSPGDDLRDDGDRKRDDEEEDLRDERPRKDGKHDRKRDEPPPKKEEDHDDLRYY